jgi:hypothetical protein
MSNKTLKAMKGRYENYASFAERVSQPTFTAPSTKAIRADAALRSTAGRALIAAIKADMLDNKKADAKAIAKLRAAAAKAKAKAKSKRAKKAVKRVVPAARRLGSEANPVANIPSRGSEFGRGV